MRDDTDLPILDQWRDRQMDRTSLGAFLFGLVMLLIGCVALVS